MATLSRMLTAAPATIDEHVCDTACIEATRHICKCRCEGRHHGAKIRAYVHAHHEARITDVQTRHNLDRGRALAKMVGGHWQDDEEEW